MAALEKPIRRAIELFQISEDQPVCFSPKGDRRPSRIGRGGAGAAAASTASDNFVSVLVLRATRHPLPTSEVRRGKNRGMHPRQGLRRARVSGLLPELPGRRAGPRPLHHRAQWRQRPPRLGAATDLEAAVGGHHPDLRRTGSKRAAGRARCVTAGASALSSGRPINRAIRAVDAFGRYRRHRQARRRHTSPGR